MTLLHRLYTRLTRSWVQAHRTITDARINDQRAEDEGDWMWTPNCPRHDHHEAGQR